MAEDFDAWWARVNVDLPVWVGELVAWEASVPSQDASDEVWEQFRRRGADLWAEWEEFLNGARASGRSSRE